MVKPVTPLEVAAVKTHNRECRLSPVVTRAPCDVYSPPLSRQGDDSHTPAAVCVVEADQTRGASRPMSN